MGGASGRVLCGDRARAPGVPEQNPLPGSAITRRTPGPFLHPPQLALASDNEGPDCLGLRPGRPEKPPAPPRRSPAQLRLLGTGTLAGSSAEALGHGGVSRGRSHAGHQPQNWRRVRQAARHTSSPWLRATAQACAGYSLAGGLAGRVDRTLNPLVRPLVCLLALLWARHRPGPMGSAGVLGTRRWCHWWVGLGHWLADFGVG